MSSIGNIGTNNMQRQDPLGIFKKTDSDGSNGISQAELKNLAGILKEKTGKNLDVSDVAFKTYDSNNDSSLSRDELKSLLDSSGFGSPQGMQGMETPPPPLQQATDSYETNSSLYRPESISDLVSTLTALLEKTSTSSFDSSQQRPSDQSASDSSSYQAGELKKLLETLTKYSDSNKSVSNSLVSVNS